MASNRYDFHHIESTIEEHWKHIAPLIKHTTQYDEKKPVFSFLEGPPTANAPPGLHHVEVRVYKDVYCRYKYMQGYSVPRKGGWDCHGLPVEVQVEKKLNLESKKDVINYGIKEFCDQCKTDIFTYIKDWEAMTRKLAYWIDLDDPYRTLDNSYIESVWWSIKQLHEKGLLYEGHKVVPYCPRCETPLSSHEVALGYKDVTEDTVVVKLQDKDNDNRYYLAWTTTPWTLPANVCLAVNPDVDYAVVKSGDKEYVLAKELAKEYFEEGEFTVVKTIKGKELLNKKYVPLFPYYDDKDAFVIVGEDYVTTEEGTGIVHQAPAFGEVDYESIKRHELPFIQNVTADGTFDNTVPDFQGQFVKEADPHIIEWLDAHGKLFSTKRFTHSYPHCWRCSTPLLYYALVSWFVEVSKIRDKLVELNNNIHWAPEHIKDGRFGKWLEGAKDWALSRFKFWGTPLPVWRCECGKIDVIGSVKELSDKRAGAELEDELTLDNTDLHKPVVDKIKLKCTCGKEMTRISHVIDCWYDSGAAPFAQYHYPFENKELFEESFPYDFISEAIDQTRGWFYTLHVLGTILFEDVAYKRCFVGGLLCDENGEKMSKSRGNILQPNELFEEYGVDAVRLVMCMYALGENVKFGRTVFNDVINPFLRILWNSHYYVHTYLKRFEYTEPVSQPDLNIEDQWILSRLNSTIKEVGQSLDDGRYHAAFSAIQTLVEDNFSRTYIKLVRARAQSKDAPLAYTFFTVMQQVVKLLGPFVPYVSDYLYRQLWPAQESVHFDTWPKTGRIDEHLEQQMDVVQDLLSAIAYAREQAKLGTRWPVKEVTVEVKDAVVSQAVHTFKDLLLSQANVKSIETVEQLPEVTQTIVFNTGTLQKEFKKDAPTIIKHLETVGPEQVYQTIKKDGLYEHEGRRITMDFLTVTRTYPKHLVEAQSKYGYVYLDTTRTQELDAEGYLREVIRRIQDVRKKLGLQKEQDISLGIALEHDFLDMLQPFKKDIKEQVGAKELSLDTSLPMGKWHHRDTLSIKKLKGELAVLILGVEKDFIE
ncbi:isoleucine--tRNA ligase [Candidatus Woesearchaeota archaeon]|nr:isoleucine--tRNA ligase [Candidatus Woesearchaeota archaeon]